MKGGRVFRTMGIKEGGERVYNVTRITVIDEENMGIRITLVTRQNLDKKMLDTINPRHDKP